MKKLDRWKCVNLLRGGRLTICSSVLSNISLYYLSLFFMPLHVSLELERLMRIFFWEGKSGGKANHLVSWKSVSKPLGDGRLGLGALKHRNMAFVAK